jgi:hypothetical protein
VNQIPTDVCHAFGLQIPGAVFNKDPSGLIHQTWIGPNQGGQVLVLQRLNSSVFPDLGVLVANYEVLRAFLQDRPFPFQALEWQRPTGASDALGFLYQDHQGEWWRAMNHVDPKGHHGGKRLSSLRRKGKLADAQRCEMLIAEAFSQFTSALSPLSLGALRTTIPRFHSGARVMDAFQAARAQDPLERWRMLGLDEKELIYSSLFLLQAFDDAVERCPTRLAHHDCKPSNLWMNASGQVCAVLDWDTLMPGSILSDFGDIQRSLSLPNAFGAFDGWGKTQMAPGEENSLRAAILRVARGFLGPWHRDLVEVEWRSLVVASAGLVAMTGFRFLSDYLLGDVYFRTDDPEENKVRSQRHLSFSLWLWAQRLALESALDDLRTEWSRGHDLPQGLR